MRKPVRKILVTGGAGFIGSAFVRNLVNRGMRPVVVDVLTYAADLKRLSAVKGGFVFYKADIASRKAIERIFNKEKPQAVAHFAAETHVDRSIRDAAPFIETNVSGTLNLLDASRRHGAARFIHISTDEVYGDIEEGSFSEDSPLLPNSPYAASKAAADLLIKSYIRTYGFPAVIVRPSNNYGPWQYPEKLIPLSILKLLRGEQVPVYGKGKNVREWLFVEDCAEGIRRVMEKGRPGQVYNLGSAVHKQNIEVVKKIVKFMDKTPQDITFVKDRLGHDIRYSLDSSKFARRTGWQPGRDFDQGLRLTIAWCLDNRKWLLDKWRHIRHLYK